MNSISPACVWRPAGSDEAGALAWWPPLGIGKAELGRRLGWHGPQIDRLLDLNHHSRIEQIDQALRAVGKVLVVSVRIMPDRREGTAVP